MILFACIAIIVVAVPLLRGRLIALADLRLRGVWALWCAALLQVAILSAPAAVDQDVLPAGHLLSYALAAVAVVANRRVPGLLLVALGGVGNLAAIASNGGVMPATPGAVRAAGLSPTTDGFVNSAANGGAHLAWLGDVFAIPAGLPLANVFSIGDVLIVVGAAVLVHRTCGSRRPWEGRTRPARPARTDVPDVPAGQVAVLRGSPAYRRLWAAHTVSGIGD